MVNDVGSQALIQDRSGVGWLIAMIGTAAGEDGVITDQQRAQLQAELESAATRGDFHMSVTMFAPLARKP